MMARVPTLFAVLVAFGIAAAPVAAQSVSNEARAAYDAEAKGDFATAQKLYRAAAMNGDAYAAFNLGNLFYSGKLGKRDFNESMRFFRIAADKGDAGSRHMVGVLYENGQGVPKSDPAEAAKWYRMAAEQGFAISQNALGTLYASGNGVPADRVQAHLWFNLASKEDQNALRRRDSTAQRMKPEEIAQAEKLAKEFKPKK